MLGGGERESGRALGRSLIIECDDQPQPCAASEPGHRAGGRAPALAIVASRGPGR
jgi:hypothetical protein